MALFGMKLFQCRALQVSDIMADQKFLMRPD
jgi:hypothetical protein